jgi:glycosyltransferase involved in cell wall biosynthesis
MGETSRLSNPTRVLAGADLLVIASVHHGLPVAPLQAMALEVPVVAVAAGEHRSLLDGKEPARGLLFHSGQPQELAAALGKVLEDPALARRLTAAARSHVMLHHELRQVIGVWEGLLGQATL